MKVTITIDLFPEDNAFEPPVAGPLSAESNPEDPRFWELAIGRAFPVLRSREFEVTVHAATPERTAMTHAMLAIEDLARRARGGA